MGDLGWMVQTGSSSPKINTLKLLFNIPVSGSNLDLPNNMMHIFVKMFIILSVMTYGVDGEGTKMALFKAEG